jgi:hypothetical protein
MPRPKNPDPNIAITIRLPQSVVDVWTEAAQKKGRSLKEHLETKLIETARNR